MGEDDHSESGDVPLCLHIAKHQASRVSLCRLYTNIKKRLAKHNDGGSAHTSKHKPWKIKNAIAFEDEEKALAFEKRPWTIPEEISLKNISNQSIFLRCSILRLWNE